MAEEKSIFQDLTCENTLDKWIKDKPFVWSKRRISFKTLIKTLGYERNEYDEEQNIESSVAVHYTLTSDKSMFCAVVYKVVEGPIGLSIFHKESVKQLNALLFGTVEGQERKSWPEDLSPVITKEGQLQELNTIATDEGGYDSMAYQFITLKKYDIFFIPPGYAFSVHIEQGKKVCCQRLTNVNKNKPNMRCDSIFLDGFRVFMKSEEKEKRHKKEDWFTHSNISNMFEELNDEDNLRYTCLTDCEGEGENVGVLKQSFLREGDKSKKMLPRDSLRKLKPETWLNDSIIDIFLHIVEVSRNVEKSRLGEVYCGNPWFVQHLMKGENDQVKAAFDRVKERINFANCKKILLPYNFQSNHWVLLEVDVEKKKVIARDSLFLIESSDEVFKKIEDFWDMCLKDIYNVSTTPLERRILSAHEYPSQDNGDDCGVFLCAAALYCAFSKAIDFNASSIKVFRKQMSLKIAQHCSVLYDLQSNVVKTCS